MGRKERNWSTRCEKLLISSDGSAVLGCRNPDGEPIVRCEDAGEYRDGTLPLGEFLCARMVASHEPHMRDPYKQTYVEACRNIDEVLSDELKTGSTKNLEQRFRMIDRDLERMIKDPELGAGDKGRYLYHIDARTLRAFLPAFFLRARDGIDAEIPEEVITAVYAGIIDILDDYSTLYDGVATQVALRRTETEILALLLRGKKAEYFPYPAVFREEASAVHERNHDSYIISNGKKIRLQVTNTDYRLPKTGKRKSESYDNSVIAIHQYIVNLDQRNGTTVITPVRKRPKQIQHMHDIADDPYYPYGEYDPTEQQFVAWGAMQPRTEDTAVDDFEFDYIQELAGAQRHGVVGALIAESRGEKLDLDEVNLLNGASHYLYALIREKRKTSS